MNPFEHDQDTAYERLRNDLLAWAGTKQVIMVASAVHGEGTTTVTSRLAATMARTSIGNVLAVDLNLARPQLHESFSVKNAVGLKEILRGSVELADVLQPTQLANLKVLSVGGEGLFERVGETAQGHGEAGTRTPGNSKPYSDGAAQLSVGMSRSVEVSRQLPTNSKPPVDVQYFHPSFAVMREQFDFTLLDAPPITLSPESASLARWTDGVLLVVQAGKTRWEVVQQAKARLEQGGAKVLGVVLNRRKFVIPDFLYGWV